MSNLFVFGGNDNDGKYWPVPSFSGGASFDSPIGPIQEYRFYANNTRMVTADTSDNYRPQKYLVPEFTRILVSNESMGSNSFALDVNDGVNLCVMGGQLSPYVFAYDISPGDAAWPIVSNIVDTPTNQVVAVSISPDGAHVACGSASGANRLLVLNTSDWSKVTVPAPVAAEHINIVQFSPDGQWLIVGSVNNTMEIYRVSDWSKLSAGMGWPGAFNGGAAFTKDQTRLAISGVETLLVVDSSDPDPLNWTPVGTQPPSQVGRGWNRRCHYSDDGQFLAVTHQNSPYQTIYNTADWSTNVLSPAYNVYGRSCRFDGDYTYTPPIPEISKPNLALGRPF